MAIGSAAARRTLADVVGDLGDELVGGDAQRAGQLDLAHDGRLQLGGNLRCRCTQRTDIDEGFIDGDLLDQVGEIVEMGDHPMGVGAVFVMVAGKYDQIGAELKGARGGHGRTNAEEAGGIGARGDDSPVLGAPTDGKGLTLQGRIV